MRGQAWRTTQKPGQCQCQVNIYVADAWNQSAASSRGGGVQLTVGFMPPTDYKASHLDGDGVAEYQLKFANAPEADEVDAMKAL